MASFVGDGKLFTAFSSACGKNPAAIGTAHPLTEAMFVSTFTKRRLEGTFHFMFLLLFLIKGGQK